ncbi:flagellar hook-basal body protein FliE [Legionella quinlivanii]|uniref:Flagellar hook-basal body complex protein FliE n=1 Tax=Legionella quinlivanii TaxID=45073 RepID=A0A0W0XLG4_9GAMM|nr:flagellar hook-basal body complex protein FliE [Legionella quinlivanii]KTD45371.1 flagellar hook-basal body protein FliE [Legionella quinlivanii]SEG14749.1 flagellar hook-basal body complex protein FliE [Legionella quinlivanii DSM 21216]STY10373.1 flagellar hook-basal body protein FliE [Legionella quinlivanii]
MTIEPVNHFKMDFNLNDLSIQKPDRFSHWLAAPIQQVNDKLIEADNSLQQLVSGQAANLHQVMWNLEEAKMSFQLLEQVRNRLMTAYQEIIKEQI